MMTTIEEKNDDGVQLKRTLGLWNGVSIIIGIIIGSGIFVSPKGVLLESGSVGVALVVWILSGVLAMLGALCFAELGTSISTSGGEYTYIRLAYGETLGFLYLWVCVMIIMPCSNAISALTFANYLLQPFYINSDNDATCHVPQNAIRLTALALVFILVYINSISVKGFLRLQNSFVLAKVAALVILITYGLYHLISGQSSLENSKSGLKSMQTVWQNSQTSLPHLAQAFYASFYTYAGWNILNCVTEELKDPVKTMPRAIFISLSSITFIYILTNLAYFAVLSPEEILESDAIAVIFGERALNHMGIFAYLSWLMPLAVATSTMGGLNGAIFAYSRVLFAGARQGHLFSVLNTIHLDYLTPVPSLIFLGALTSVYLITTEILTLITYMVFVEAVFAALGVSTVLRLRYLWPNIARPLKLPTFVPILYLIFSFLLIVMPIWTSPYETLIGISIMLSGIPVYYLTANWKVKPLAYQRSVDSFNKFTQKLTKSVTPSQDISISNAGI